MQLLLKKFLPLSLAVTAEEQVITILSHKANLLGSMLPKMRL